MYNEPAFSTLIYEYFVLRFQFQYYQCGDYLPPIDALCRKFNVSPLTVKTALKRLQEEDYVSIRHGKCTQVTFKQSDEAYQKFKQDFFACRIPLYANFEKALDLIFCPLYVESFHRMDEEDFTNLRRIAERLDSDDLVNFYCYLLQKIENPLALNLFWETSLFLGFPSFCRVEIPDFYNIEQLKSHMYQLIERGEKGDWESIFDAQFSLEQDITEKYIGHVSQQMREKTLEESPVFRWRIYRDRPQICHSLATHILHHIYLGEYYKESFLPSYQAMAERCQVSVSTIRRTVHLLSEIGAVCSINGKGTRILSLDEGGYDANFGNPAIRRNLAYFLHALELIKFSIGGVSRTVLPTLTAASKDDLILQLEGFLREDRCVLAPNQLLVSLSSSSPLAEIREIYEKLYLLMLWGMPLIRHRQKESSLEEMTKQFTEEVITSLKAEDFDRCAALLEDIFGKLYPIGEAYLQRQGMKPEELRLPLAIRL